MVLYRKYRPRNWDEIIGQEHIVKTLINSLQQNKVSHAYLFAGPKGTGKTTIARLLAKAVNQPQKFDFANCLDIIEIDGASNRGIEEVRDLKENIKFSPTELRYKIFIIDEVHMLTTPAFNALLKTLEEPPEHAIFILATTEAHKILPTIISRCQRFDFKKLNLKQIIELLSNIAKKEKIKIEDEALRLIAVVSSGDLRDAISILDQAISTEDKNISLQEVQNILGVSDIRPIIKFVDLIAKKEIKELLKLINRLNQEGLDLYYFSKNLIDYLRKLLILKTDFSLRELAAPELTDAEFSTIIRQGKKFKERELVDILKILLSAQNQIKQIEFPQLPLEIAAVEICLEKL